MTTGAVIAAAGMPSQPGQFKPMLNIGAISISQRIITTFRHAGVSKIVMVTGYNAHALEHHLAKYRVIFIRNENYRETQMIASAKIGLGYLAGKCDRVLFTPVDIPLFTRKTVERLLSSRAELACPVYRGRPGHPVLLSAAVIEKVLADTGEGGLREALSRSGFRSERIEVDDAGILHDAESQEDRHALLEYHNYQSIRPVAEVSLAKERPFFDAKTAMLLALIGETASVMEACRRMKLSYSSGWNIINSLEAQLGFPIVRRRQGGLKGGKSELTPEGHLLLQRYEHFLADVGTEVEKLFGKHFSGILTFGAE